MAAAADPADAWRHDQARLRVLAAQDDLESAEHAAFGPGRADDAVVDGDSNVEIAFYPAERTDMKIDGTHRCEPLAAET